MRILKIIIITILFISCGKPKLELRPVYQVPFKHGDSISYTHYVSLNIKELSKNKLIDLADEYLDSCKIELPINGVVILDNGYNFEDYGELIYQGEIDIDKHTLISIQLINEQKYKILFKGRLIYYNEKLLGPGDKL